MNRAKKLLALLLTVATLLSVLPVTALATSVEEPPVAPDMAEEPSVPMEETDAEPSSDETNVESDDISVDNDATVLSDESDIETETSAEVQMPVNKAPAHVSADAEVLAEGTVDSLTWTVYDDGTLVIGGTGDMPDYKSNTRPWFRVNGINYLQSYTSVVVEEGVTSIGKNAFYFMKNLTSVELPSTLTAIGDYAFGSCQSLTSLTIPDGVTSIGGSAFYWTRSLTDLVIPASVTSIGRDAFKDSLWLENQDDFVIVNGILVYYQGDGGTVTVPATTVGMVGGAFSDMEEEIRVILPETWAELPEYAFYDCTALTEVRLPSGLTEIPANAFYDCSNLPDIIIPSSVTKIGNAAFNACGKLTNVSIPSGVTSLGKDLFYYCDGLKSVTLPTKITDIPESCFDGCESLEEITLPKKITTIGFAAFRSCTALKNVTVYAGLDKINKEAFSDCSSLTDIYFYGTEDDWGAVSNLDSSDLKTVTVHYLGVDNSLDVPELISAESVLGGVRIAWEPVDYADGYYIFRKTDGEDWTDDSVMAAAQGSDADTFLDDTAISGTTYVYSVAAFNTDADGDYDENGLCITYVAVPVIDALTIQSNGIRITWDMVEGAEKYAVLRKDSSGNWETLGATAGQNWVDRTAIAGNEYTYTVRCVTYDGSTYTSGLDETGKSITYYYATPAVSDLMIQSNGILITWNKVTGAAKYAVLRKDSSGDWVTLGATAGQSWVDRTAIAGNEYTYTVRCVSSDGSTFTSDLDETGKSVTYYYATPAVSSLTVQNNGILITWNKVAGAAKYAVLRMDSSGNWETLGATAGQNWVDRTAAAGSKYTYTVRCVSSDGNTYTSDWDETGKSVMFYYVTPTVSNLENLSGGVRITWTRIDGAAKYRVFRKTESGGWVRLGDTSALNWVDRSAEGGSSYTYTVRCVSADGKTYTSNFDKAGKTITFFLPAPTINKPEGLSNGIRISWSKVDGAERYRVLRKTENSDWEPLGDTASLSWTDRTAVSGTKYSYTVRCITSSGTDASFIDRTGKSATFIAPPTLRTAQNSTNGVQLSWNTVTGAAKYRVYRKTVDGDWTLLGTTSALGWTDRTAESGTTYTYAISALDAEGIVSVGWEGRGKTVAYLAYSSVRRLINTADGMEITWNAINGAERYRIFRKEDGGSWSILTSTVETTFLDRNVVSGVTYTYTVCCVSADDTKVTNAYDKTGKTLICLAMPENLQLEDSSRGVELTWSKVGGNVTYRLYRKTVGGNWSYLADLTATHYLDDTVRHSTTYYYTVRCYADTEHGAVFSAYDTDGTMIAVPDYTPPVSYTFSTAYRNSVYFKRLMAVRIDDDRRAAIQNVALSQLGYTEGNSASAIGGGANGGSNYTEFGRWYYNNIDSSDVFYRGAWCSMFVSWCANEAGISTDIVPRRALVAYMKDAFDEMGRYYTWKQSSCGGGKQTIRPGDLIIFSSKPLGRLNHIGIVTSVTYSGGQTTINTVEGNKLDACRTMTYTLSTSSLTGYNAEEDTYIRGFACPNYGY